jgi:hypothetical protein
MADPMNEPRMNAESEYSFFQRGQIVQRARKIVNSALFEAINQGSLEGVTSLIERGVDPTAEDRQGRTPLDFAGHLAEKYPEELERQAIVDFLRNWDSEQYAADDAAIVNGARRISGLDGGVKWLGNKPKTANATRSGTAGFIKSGTAGAKPPLWPSVPPPGAKPSLGLGVPPINIKPPPRPSVPPACTKPPSGLGVPSTSAKLSLGLGVPPTGPFGERGIAHAAASIPSSGNRVQESSGMLSRIGEMAIELIPEGETYQILNNGDSAWDATKSLAVDTVITYAGVQFCKIGGKVITQTERKVFELVKDEGKVLLKEDREELEKAFGEPKLEEPALAGPETRLPQAPNRDLPNVSFRKSAGKGGNGRKLAPRPKSPKSPKRIVNTLEDCTKYIDNKVSSGICRKTGKRFKGRPVYKVVKKDGILKKGDYIYKNTKHREIELMESDLKTHKGAIDLKTGNIYKEGVPGRNIRDLI